MFIRTELCCIFFLGSFEITVNDVVIYSKLEKGGFPEFSQV